jgi:SPP1 family predicted phage head-tail adaptor
MGGETLTWATQYTVWASIWPVSAMEQIRAAAPTMMITHRVKIRYNSDLSPSWRVKFGTRYFSIVSIINPDERNEMQELLCKEVL